MEYILTVLKWTIASFAILSVIIGAVFAVCLIAVMVRALIEDKDEEDD